MCLRASFWSMATKLKRKLHCFGGLDFGGMRIVFSELDATLLCNGLKNCTLYMPLIQMSNQSNYFPWNKQVFIFFLMFLFLENEELRGGHFFYRRKAPRYRIYSSFILSDRIQLVKWTKWIHFQWEIAWWDEIGFLSLVIEAITGKWMEFFKGPRDRLFGSISPGSRQGPSGRTIFWSVDWWVIYLQNYYLWLDKHLVT